MIYARINKLSNFKNLRKRKKKGHSTVKSSEDIIQKEANNEISKTKPHNQHNGKLRSGGIHVFITQKLREKVEGKC